MIYLDTHVVAWLFAGKADLLPEIAKTLIEESELLISPAVSLELQYLYEIRRTAEPARVVLQTLASELGLKICDLPFPHVIEAALDEGWTRDPFDRLIVAQAKVRDAPLLTKDRTIHENYPGAVWSRTPTGIELTPDNPELAAQMEVAEPEMREDRDVLQKLAE